MPIKIIKGKKYRKVKGNPKGTPEQTDKYRLVRDRPGAKQKPVIVKRKKPLIKSAPRQLMKKAKLKKKKIHKMPNGKTMSGSSHKEYLKDKKKRKY